MKIPEQHHRAGPQSGEETYMVSQRLRFVSERMANTGWNRDDEYDSERTSETGGKERCQGSNAVRSEAVRYHCLDISILFSTVPLSTSAQSNFATKPAPVVIPR